MDIKVYSTPTCMYCNMLKDYLKQQEIEFAEIDVAADDTAREYIIEKSGQMGVPVTEINGEVVVGFNEAKISEMIASAKSVDSPVEDESPVV